MIARDDVIIGFRRPLAADAVSFENRSQAEMADDGGSKSTEHNTHPSV